jgi:hypothetical protein
MAYANSGLLGCNVSATYTSAEAATLGMSLGTLVTAQHGQIYEFVKTLSTVAQYDCVVFLANTSASDDFTQVVAPADATNGALSYKVGIAQVAIASGYYGWVAINGAQLQVKALVACQPAVPLFLTSTAGSVDDAIASAAGIVGLIALTSATSASSVTCIAAFPHIGFLRAA